jgi:small-conductance mechanosensitive channel
MGKPPLTEEQLKLKELTRELHEAAKDARAAAKELNAARDAVWDDARAMLQALVDEARNELQVIVDKNMANLNQSSEKIADQLKAVDRAIVEHFAALAGEYSPESFRDLVERDIAAAVRGDLYDPEYIAILCRQMITFIDADSGGPGSLARAGQAQRAVWQASWEGLK